LCLTIVGAPPQDPLHEVMQFTTALYTMVAIWIATLWVTVSLAAQFVLGGLPAEVYQVDVVGEMLAKLWERVERCLHLKDL
jgi:hypothetical protein